MLICVVLRLICVDLSRISCNLLHMTTSSPPASPLQPLNEGNPAAGTVLTGVPVVPGIAYAPVIRPGRHPVLDFVAKAIEVAEADRDAEVARFAAAAAAVADRLRERAAHATGSASEVLAATAQLAQDRAWLGEAEKRIRMGTPAVRATAEAVEKFVGHVHQDGRPDGRTRHRPAGHPRPRHRQLSGLPEPGVPVPDVPSILCAEDLAPADTAGLDPALIVGAGDLAGRPDQPHRDHRAAVGDSVRGGDQWARRGRRRHDGDHRRRTRAPLSCPRTPTRPRRRCRPERRPPRRPRAGRDPAPPSDGQQVCDPGQRAGRCRRPVGRADSPPRASACSAPNCASSTARPNRPSTNRPRSTARCSRRSRAARW